MARASAPAGLIVPILALVMLGGCIGDGSDDTAPDTLSSVDVYEYRYAGDDKANHNFPYGWMARVSNPSTETQRVVISSIGSGVAFGVVDEATGWDPHVHSVTFAPGLAVLFLFHIANPNLHNGSDEVGFGVSVINEAGTVAEHGVFTRTLTDVPTESTQLFRPGDRVLSVTVGVWSNGTSFYTDIADLNGDPSFPAGYPRTDFDDSILTVYIWDQAATENPPGNRDNCWYPTITGFNDLLQATPLGGTNVAWLKPEDAYTLAGREDHFLYGDSLVFQTTILGFDGTTTDADKAPDPEGECADYRNTVNYAAPGHGLPLPAIPPTL